MPKSENQKMKLLLLKDIFEQQTDEQHPVTIQQLIEKLAANGVKAERKSLYDDLRVLQDYGMDIIPTHTAGAHGYYLGSRMFEVAELKLLVDAVQSCRFLSAKKSTALIKKLEQLAGADAAKELQHQVYVAHRVKTMNESVYYTIDALHSAIAQNRQVAFRYVNWTPDKKMDYRGGGKLYCVSPFALVWDEENYYLVAYDDEAARMKHYRVDKMEKLAICETSRLGAEVFAKVDMTEYGKAMFGMFGGTAVPVRLRVATRLAGTMLDRFGKELSVTKVNEDTFDIGVNVVPSPPFLGWVASFGDEVRIMAPKEVREEFVRLCKKATKQYKKDEE